jgi:hypothetical protein
LNDVPTGRIPVAYPEEVPAQPNEEKDEPVRLPLDPEKALRALIQIRADDGIGSFVATHPDLIPTLRAMVWFARNPSDSDPERLGEFSHDWLASREPSTPQRLTAFTKAGIIQDSPRGKGSGRRFYVLVDADAVEDALDHVGPSTGA